MSYVEVKYYRFYPLEIREYGDTGWAIHVYVPRRDHGNQALAVFQDRHPSSLGTLLAAAHAVIDADVDGSVSSFGQAGRVSGMLRRRRTPSTASTRAAASDLKDDGG
jgi:hypothetical protein